MVVVIPKGGVTDFRGIGRVEVLWNEITCIINRRLFSSISFHDVMHSFCEGRGMGTATLEAKLLQHLTDMKEAVLHSIFLSLIKACINLDTD